MPGSPDDPPPFPGPVFPLPFVDRIDAILLTPILEALKLIGIDWRQSRGHEQQASEPFVVATVDDRLMRGRVAGGIDTMPCLVTFEKTWDWLRKVDKANGLGVEISALALSPDSGHWLYIRMSWS